MSTTLPLFWDLSSASKQKRLKSSAELISTLQHFQAQFAPPAEGDDDDDSSNDSQDDDDDESGEEVDGSDDGEGVVVDKDARRLDHELDRKNSEDVRYSIRRLVRGLASPRESSRLGFAVALTELLSRLTTITPRQIISLVLRASLITVSSRGQETRDLLFARLFGLTSVVQSGLLYRPTATIDDFKTVVQELVNVGKQKAWLRESCWWAVIKAIEGLEAGQVEWRTDAGQWVAELVFADQEGKMDWTPEKVALGLKMQEIYPSLPWKTLFCPPFKHTSLLHPTNLPIISRILKEASSAAEDEDEPAAASTSAAAAAPNKNGTGSWKPHPHFVWDMILDAYFPKEGSAAAAAVKERAAFSDFYRVVVDESLFDVKTSSERKFWGFQIFEKALPRLPASEIPLVFTPNFMRVWINNLSGEDRYLHKAALSIAKLVQTITATDPAVGFTLVSQLLGKNGNQNFDKITKTKTVSGVLSSLSVEGVREYVDYLKGLVYNSQEAPEEFDFKRTEARRTWVFDQMLALIKNGSIPKEDTWVLSIIEFFVLHGMFAIKQANKKSTFVHLQTLPNPSFSDSLHAICRTRLSSVLGELTSESSLIKGADGKTSRVHGSDSTGTLWISRALDIVYALEKDTKHVTLVTEDEEIAEEVKAARKAARDALGGLSGVSKERKETAKGLELLIQSVILQSYDEPEESIDVLEELQGCAAKMFAKKSAKSAKKARKTAIDMEDADEEAEDLDPMDLLVDVLIGFLERSSSQLRALATQVFGMLSGEVTESTVDLLLAQLESRPVTAEEEDELMEDNDDEENGEDEEEEEEEDESEEEEEEEDSADVDPELRKRIAEALQVNGADAVGGAGGDGAEDSDSEDELLMDDDQMLALDDKLAEIFKSQVMGKKGKKDAQREAVHFKNRVLDIIETFVKKQPTSPLILRLVLPLLEIILNSGPTELHLSSKATGILVNRICKAKDVPSVSDRSEALEILGELHVAARKAQSAAVAKTCSSASVFLARALLQDDESKKSKDEVVAVYLASLEDFMTKKTTKVKAGLFFDLVQRFPVVAWEMREQVLKYAREDGANGYRQTQAFLILNEMVGQVPALTKAGLSSTLETFVPETRQAIYTILASPTLKADRLKEIAKFAVKLARSTASIITPAQMPTAWKADELKSLVETVKTTERLKGSGALHALLAQLVRVVTGEEEKKGGKKGGKAAEVVAPVDAKAKKSDAAPKRKLKKGSEKEEGAAAQPEKKRKKKAAKAVELEIDDEVEME